MAEVVTCRDFAGIHLPRTGFNINLVFQSNVLALVIRFHLWADVTLINFIAPLGELFLGIAAFTSSHGFAS